MKKYSLLTVRCLYLICCITSILLLGESFAASSAGGDESGQNNHIRELAPEEQLRLAEHYAPMLVFNSSEKYFPCNPLFSLELENVMYDKQSAESGSKIHLLGNVESRTATYDSLSIQEKAQLGTLYYRAFPARRNAEEKIVIEYWLYYVQNRYRARGTIIPLSFDGSHPNDMEHIHVVLKIPQERSSWEPNLPTEARYAIEEVYSSAHEGTIPANRYRYYGKEWSGENRILVELGSHANAPDIDQDGSYTPGQDGDSGHKMLWGIRDKGATWIRYSRSYMVPRIGENSITFSHTGSRSLPRSDPKGILPNNRYSYRLIPVWKLREDFAKLGLTIQQRKEAFETDVNWFRRVLGGSNGNSNKLLVPPDSKKKGNNFGIKDFSSTERGFLVGGTNLVAEPGVFVGGRYSFLNGIKYLPDVMLEADGILTTRGKGYLSTQFLLTYPIDASIRLMGGGDL